MQRERVRQCRSRRGHPLSDVGLLVDLDDRVGLVALSALDREFSDLLGTHVDVAPTDTLKRTVRDDVPAAAISQ
jgi:predicted nucleotidyltransferase